MLGLVESKAKKKKKKKVTLCLNGQTIKAPKKKRKAYLNKGATPGACSSSPPPCVGACAGKPCGADDGCGGTCGCPADQLCQAGACHACDVTCSGSAAQCGTALQEKLSLGGTIRVCPGRYAGILLIEPGTSVTLIGAGRGTDPTTSTILDGMQTKRVLDVEEGATAALEHIHLTGGRSNFCGGGVLNAGTPTMYRCAVTGNRVTNASGGGLCQNSIATGSMTLTDCTISGNNADNHGGGVVHFGAGHQVTLANCTISDNHAGVGGTGNGGGVACSEGVLRITGGSVTGNSAQAGGGVWASATGTDAAVTGVAMSGNTPTNCMNVPGCP